MLDYDTLLVRSVESTELGSHEHVHALPAKLFLPADSCGSVSPRMSRTETYLCRLGSMRSSFTTTSNRRPATAVPSVDGLLVIDRPVQLEALVIRRRGVEVSDRFKDRAGLGNAHRERESRRGIFGCGAWRRAGMRWIAAAPTDLFHHSYGTAVARVLSTCVCVSFQPNCSSSPRVCL
jgi:hypothetical protein